MQAEKTFVAITEDLENDAFRTGVWVDTVGRATKERVVGGAETQGSLIVQAASSGGACGVGEVGTVWMVPAELLAEVAVVDALHAQKIGIVVQEGPSAACAAAV